MNFLFFNAAGQPIFSRNDAEEASNCHEEMRLSMVFPYDHEKVIVRGMRVGYTDSLGVFQAFEIRQARDLEPDHAQEITAEHIAISELTDEVFPETEWTNITAQAALTALLTGTLWSVGTVTASGTSSADISNGDVWAGVRTIEKNWNVYITPRITVSASGITGRYLDIAPAGGVFRGLRFSLEKNMDQAGVAWNDEKLKTALYGWGKNDGSGPLTFADVVWTATAEHPAKPSGQTYLEDSAATAAYGRNGRARFGYYQNGQISDANILLQKTWETLKTVNVPDVSIDGSVRNLRKLGNLAEVPIRLHDEAQVEIRPTDVILRKEVIRYTEDLINPLNDRVTIGDYIPNIIYINRENSGGGGGSGGQTNEEYRFTADLDIFESNYRSQIALVVQEHDGQYVVNTASIVLALNESGSDVIINADKIDLQGYVTANQLSAEIGSFYNASTGTLSSSWITSQGGQIGNLTVSGTFNCGVGQTASWQTTTVDGVTLHYLGSAPT